MAQITPTIPATPAPPPDQRPWTERFSRSGYFLAALLFHLIIFLMVATWILFPAFKPPVDDFTKTYLPPPSPPPPPPSSPTPQVPTHTVAPPTPAITSLNPTPTFSIPLPDLTHTATPDTMTAKMTAPVVKTKNNLAARLGSIMATETGSWGRDENNIRESNGDPRNVVAKFPVYLASYASGDWYCNVRLLAGKIDGGSLPNLVAKMNEWSHDKITGEVVPIPLSIGGPDLMAKRPPFIFFTGHRDFILTEGEISNLRDYLQVGGMIWGDNALAGRGSRFDVAFRREMKRVVPDKDKNFVDVDMNDDMFNKSWYNISKLPSGMNYYAEPIERLDIDDKLAILYTPNDYSDMMYMRILPGDQDMMVPTWGNQPAHTLFTYYPFWGNKDYFFHNFELPSCLAVQQLGMNIIGYLLVRFDKELEMAP